MEKPAANKYGHDKRKAAQVMKRKAKGKGFFKHLIDSDKAKGLWKSILATWISSRDGHGQDKLVKVDFLRRLPMVY